MPGVSGPMEMVLLVLFILIALATAFLALRVQPPRVVAILRETMHNTGQLPVRISILLLATLFEVKNGSE